MPAPTNGYANLTCISARLILREPVNHEDSVHVQSIRIMLDNEDGVDEPAITTVDGMLQMLECPCYAALWR